MPHRKSLAALTTAVLSATLMPLSLSSASATPAAQACERVLPKPARLASVVQDKGTAAQVSEARRAKALAVAEDRLPDHEGSVREQARDHTLWLDSCGAPFYAEPLATEGEEEPAQAEAAPLPLSSTFELASKPGAQKTIYLDFTGGTVSGTAWNADYGDPLIAKPFSQDSDPAFNERELQTIQEAWLTVAEDYAPFDVNVTTKEPSSSALYRDSYGDPVFGIHAYITPDSPIYEDCGCGGVAYVGITKSSSTSSLRTYGPAWVFSDSLYSGSSIGEAAAHEIGHNLGLAHDGDAQQGYHAGSAPWAPIMGVGYYQPLSQWSRGEYAGATNQEDDTAIINGSFPYRADDHSAGASPTELKASTLQGGVIERVGDQDSFAFTAAGPTTFQVTPSAFQGNLDSAVTIYDSSGAVVTRAAPVTTRETAATALGADATASFTAPTAGARYKAVVQGAGQGDPAGQGYSAYGSLGPYSVLLTTAAPEEPTPEEPVEPEPEEPNPEPPVEVSGRAFSTLEQGKAFSAQLVASGGAGTYSWSATHLPPGLTLTSTGLLQGTPTSYGTFTATATVVSGDSRGTATLTFSVVKRIAFSTGSKLPAAKYKKAYRSVLKLTGGKAGYSWSRTGRLPRGVKLRLPAAGSTSPRAIVTGRPLKKGTFYITVKARDSYGMVAKRTFKLVVRR